MEYLNPGGTSKDRIAASMIKEAEASGKLKKGGTVVEGTSGSTGICLASLCRAKGYRCVIVMPDDQVRDLISQGVERLAFSGWSPSIRSSARKAAEFVT